MMKKLNQSPRPTIQGVTSYIALRFKTGITFSTLANELSGIIHYATRIGVNTKNWSLKAPIINKLKKGYKKLNGNNSDIRIAISLKQLESLVLCIALSEPDALIQATQRTALIIAFWHMLRASEYTYHSKIDGNKHILKMGHIKLFPKNSMVHINIPSPKTNKNGVQLTLSSCKCSINADICPFHVLSSYISLKKKLLPSQYNKVDSPLFMIPNDYLTSGYGVLAYNTWLNWFKEFADMIKVSRVHFKPHSLRVSGATYLFKQGCPEKCIKLLGRWKSNCWTKYVRLTPNECLLFIDTKIIDSTVEVEPTKLNKSLKQVDRILNTISISSFINSKSKRINKSIPTLEPIS